MEPTRKYDPTQLYVSVLVTVLALAVCCVADAQEIVAVCAKWCGPCQQMQPVLDGLESEGVKVRRVDFDRERGWAQQHGVKLLPTFIGLDAQGNEVGRLVGKTTRANLLAIYERRPESVPAQDGGWHPVQLVGWDNPAVVHLNGGGTGALIDIAGVPYVLSCAHKDHHGNPFKVGDRAGFYFNDGAYADCTVVQVNEIPVDACILRIDTQLTRKPSTIPVATQYARQGDTVTVLGFPMGSWNVRQARVDGYADKGLSMQLIGAGIPGESGGPILNSSGEIVGVLSRTGGGYTWCCPLPRITELQNRVRGALDQLAPNRTGAFIPRQTPRQSHGSAGGAGSAGPAPSQPAPPQTSQQCPPANVTVNIDYERLGIAIAQHIQNQPAPPAEPAAPQIFSYDIVPRKK